MNLRNAVEMYANAVSSRDYYHVVGDGKREAESMARLAVCGQSLDVVLAVAEAAMAIVEQQEAVDNYAFADAVMGRGELWEQYKAAKAKAKDANQSDDLGEALAVLRRLVVHACVDSGHDAAKSVEAFVDARALLKKHGA